MSGGITLKFEGFEELLQDIEAAGRSMNSAVESCMKQSAKIQYNELKKQMSKAGVDKDLINRMPSPTVEWQGNQCRAEIGYKKGSYDSNNPSDGYKVVFLNYGTPHRSVHGKVAARGFIKKAKAKAKPQIKKSQEETLKKILSRLQG